MVLEPRSGLGSQRVSSGRRAPAIRQQGPPSSPPVGETGSSCVARLLGTGLALCAAMVALRAHALGLWMGPLRHAEWRELARTAVSSLFHAYHDIIIVAGLTALFAGVLVAARGRPAARSWISSVFAALAAALCVLSVVNVQAVRILGGPVTYQWLYYADFLRSFTPQNALLEAVSPRLLAGLVLAPAALLIGARMAEGLLRRFWRPRRPAMAALVLGSLATVYAFGASAYLRRAKVSPGAVANPLAELVRTALLDGTQTLLTAPAAADVLDFSVAAEREPSPTSPPLRADQGVSNVLIVVMESVGAKYVLSELGGRRTTPHLDAVRPISLRFDNFYAHFPASPKSLFTLLTSNYPETSFRYETVEHQRGRFATLSAELQSRGYRTAFFMSGDLRFQSGDAFVRGRGFETLADIGTIPCRTAPHRGSTPTWQFLDSVADACTADALNGWIAEDRERPFFAVFWTNDTHWPYFPQGEEADYGVGNRYLNRYLNALRGSDQAIGRVLERLESTGRLASTLVIVVGDHGEAFGERGHLVHGETLYEEEIRIPLVLVNPLLGAERRSSTLGGLVDVAPTVMDVLQLPVPGLWQGRSLFADRRPDRVYFSVAYRDVLAGYREGDWKYILNDTRNRLEVYDLAADPGERADLQARAPRATGPVRERVAAWVQYQRALIAKLSAAPR